LQQRKSKWTNQYKRIHSSKFHETVRQIFVTDPFFKNLSCYQEVQVSALAPGYSSNMHCVDWYIEEFRLIIELHGEQHYKATNYGSGSYESTQKNFNNMKYRDNLKKTALINAGYEYIEIPYKMLGKLNGDFLKNIIFK